MLYEAGKSIDFQFYRRLTKIGEKDGRNPNPRLSIL